MVAVLAALSPGQVTFFAVYGWTLALWLVAEFLNWRRSQYEVVGSDLETLVERGDAKDDRGHAVAATSNGRGSGGSSDDAPKPPPRLLTWQGMVEDCVSSGLIRCMLFDLSAIKDNRDTLRSMAELGSLMVWYFMCDRTSLFNAGEKSYSRDVFAFLFLVLTAVAFGSSNQLIKAPVLLARQQTEEWKGWMQVLFLLYHYFEAREIYNAIRIFIAAYVWMTGFGNFSYYYKTGDYCVGRFAQMMWRLNFLVFVVCLVMRNSYMLYYICPMHTIYTVLVYACLGIAAHWNQHNGLLAVKMVLALVFVLVFWDIKGVFYFVWKPLTWLVGYDDPRKDDNDVLYEWFFRSSLDRFVWIYGMLCAWAHPHASALLTLIDNLPAVNRALVRSAVLSAVAVVGYFWSVAAAASAPTLCNHGVGSHTVSLHRIQSKQPPHVTLHTALNPPHIPPSSFVD